MLPGLGVGSETGETDGMERPPDPHYRHRFPAEIISHAVWLYHVFSLSFRDVELLLAERGIIVSYETVRRCARNSARPSPAVCVDAARGPVTNGTLMVCHEHNSGKEVRSCTKDEGGPLGA